MRTLLNSSLLVLTLVLAAGCQHGKSGCGSQSCGKQACGRECGSQCGPQCTAPQGMTRPYASAGVPATSGTAPAYTSPSAPPRTVTSQPAAPAYRSGDTAPPAPGVF